MVTNPIFIVGCPRSGTSLLRDLLRSHPNLTFPQESHFIPAFFRAYGNPRNEQEAVKLGQAILNTFWVKNWGLDLEPACFSECRSFAEVISRLYGEWGRKQGKKRWGDKTPQYVTQIPILVRLFPSCKIIHVHRDGRDVALSWMLVGWGPQNVYIAARDWKYYVNAGRGAASSVPPGAYLEVRYEHLLSRPEETMKRICSFIDEPFCPDVLKPNFLERRRRLPIIGKPRTWTISRSEIVTANSEKWKKTMSPSDRVTFESVAGDVLEKLDYETEKTFRSISRAERLKWNTHQVFWYVLRRLNDRSEWPQIRNGLLLRWADRVGGAGRKR